MANSLAHAKWVCKCYIVFTPKYRRKITYYEAFQSWFLALLSQPRYSFLVAYTVFKVLSIDELI